jgi:hypothetical protein
MHLALRIGPYSYELLTDENMIISWRYMDETRSESWKSAILDMVVEETSARDAELVRMGKSPALLLVKRTSPSSDLANDVWRPEILLLQKSTFLGISATRSRLGFLRISSCLISEKWSCRCHMDLRVSKLESWIRRGRLRSQGDGDGRCLEPP